MRKLIVALTVVVLCGPAAAGTRLFAFYGLGGQRTSAGIDQIVEQARNTIPGITHVAVYNQSEWRRATRDIDGVPPEDKVVLIGYSCGMNKATVIAHDIARHIDTIAGMQMSEHCGGFDLGANVGYGQVTYGGCISGLGCKQLAPASGFTGRILNIYRPETHGQSDTDPDYQADVLRAIKWTAGGEPPNFDPDRLHYGHGGALVRRGAAKLKTGAAMVKKGVQEMTLHHGESP
jgi:hypothetical protein